MSINLLELMQSAVSNKVVGQVAGVLGVDEASANKAVGGALPALLAGFIGKASTDDGAEQLGAVLDQADGTILDNIGEILGGADGGADRLQEMGSGLIGGLFGDKVEGLLDLLAGASGLGKDKTGSLLGTIVPIIFSLLGKQKKGLGLDAAGFAKLLLGQKDILKGVMPPGLSGVLGLTGFDDDNSVTAAADNLKDAVVDAATDKVDDAKDAVAGAVDDVKGVGAAATGLAAGALGGIAAAATGAVDNVKDAASGAVDAAADAVGDVKDAAAGAADAAADKVGDVKDAAAGAVDAAADKVGDVKDAAAGAVDAAADKVGDVKDATVGAVDAAADKVGDVKDAAVDKVEDVKASVSSGASAVADSTASAAKSGGGVLKILIPLIILGILGVLVWKFVLSGASPSAANIELPAPAEISTDNAVSTMGSLIAKTTATLKSVKDEDSARAAVAEFDSMEGTLNSLSGKIGSLPEGVREKLKKSVRGYGPKFNDLVEKAFAIPGVKPILEPKIDQLIETLTKFG